MQIDSEGSATLIYMKKLYILGIVAIVALILIVAGTWYMSNGSAFQLQTASSTPTSATTTTTTANEVPTKTTGTPTTPMYGLMLPPKGTTTGSVPKISSMTPAAGGVGTTVTIIGSGFSTTKNYVLFGTSSNRSHPDGSPDNSVATAGSPDGKTLSFTVPSAGPSGLLCDSNNHCIGVSAIRITPGQYPVAVRNQYGTSVTDIFTVTGS